MTHCLLATLVNAAAMRIEISALTDTTINDRRRCCLVDGGGSIMVGVWANDMILVASLGSAARVVLS